MWRPRGGTPSGPAIREGVGLEARAEPGGWRRGDKQEWARGPREACSEVGGIDRPLKGTQAVSWRVSTDKAGDASRDLVATGLDGRPGPWVFLQECRPVGGL